MTSAAREARERVLDYDNRARCIKPTPGGLGEKLLGLSCRIWLVPVGVELGFGDTEDEAWIAAAAGLERGGGEG